MRTCAIQALILVAFFFTIPRVGGLQAAGQPVDNGDVNANGMIEIGDAIYILSYLFASGPAPIPFEGDPALEARLASLEEAVELLRNSLPTVEEVADQLVASHADTLRGPPGPRGPRRAAGTDWGESPVHLALAKLTQLFVEPTMSHIPRADVLQQIGCGATALTEIALAVGGESVGEVLGFVGHESISRPYEFQIAVQTAGTAAGIESAVGSAGRLGLGGDPAAVVNGTITAAGLAAFDGSQRTYVVTLVPALSALSRTTDYAIDQEQHIPDVVVGLLEKRGIGDRQRRLTETYPVRDCVVQYGETDLAFINQRLEWDGIFYFFVHTGEQATLVLGDSNGAFEAAADGRSFSYYGHEAPSATPFEEYVRTVRLMRREVTGKATVTDYDFKEVQLATGEATAAEDAGELYEYGTNLNVLSDASDLARVRLQEQQARGVTAAGTSTVRGLRAGHAFRLNDTTGVGFSGTYVVTTARHVGLRVEIDEKACFYYGNAFTAIPVSQPYRPPRITPKTVVKGPQTAKVTGPAGEEIYTEEFGRVKVKFHWDRVSPDDNTSSCWIRVAQNLAGTQWGTFHIPRVGMEVIVDFVNGDPDRPLVTGCVYNAENMPPYVLPDSKTRSVMKSATSPGGGNFNELTFDDVAGSELVTVTSAKDMNISSANDMSLSSGTELTISSATETVVEGPAAFTSNADPSKPIAPGERHRDNAVVAWARVEEDGSVGIAAFGILSVKREAPGWYTVAVHASAASANELIPMATVAVDRAPRTVDDLRFLSIAQGSPNRFQVFISNTTSLVNNAFVFMAVAR